jgi:hypothetical protein
MQQSIGLGIAALAWSVVCFAFGFVVAILRRLSEENTLLRSTVSALSCAPSPPQQSVPNQQLAVPARAESAPEAPVPASDLSCAVPTQQQSVAAGPPAATATLQPQASLSRKVYLFGDPHAAVPDAPPRQAPATQTSASGWPGQPRSAPPRITAGETDLLPHLPQRRREHLRRR